MVNHMKWQDQGVVLGARRYGESSWLVSLMTLDHGRHKGILRGTGKSQLICQPGNNVQASWSARLSDHLGFWQLELISSPLVHFLSNPKGLLGLLALSSILEEILAERHPYPTIYETQVELISQIAANNPLWLKNYVEFELLLLEQLGYGLDLSKCAVTGTTDTLSFVSPKSGRAVSLEAGLPYREKLLTLPNFLRPSISKKTERTDQQDWRDGLFLTGFFLSKTLFSSGLPENRCRLFEQLEKESAL